MINIIKKQIPISNILNKINEMTEGLIESFRSSGGSHGVVFIIYQNPDKIIETAVIKTEFKDAFKKIEYFENHLRESGLNVMSSHAFNMTDEEIIDLISKIGASKKPPFKWETADKSVEFHLGIHPLTTSREILILMPDLTKIHGTSLEDLKPETKVFKMLNKNPSQVQDIMVDLGKLFAMDILHSNTDRFPTYQNLFDFNGNKGNIMFTIEDEKVQLVCMDNTIRRIDKGRMEEIIRAAKQLLTSEIYTEQLKTIINFLKNVPHADKYINQFEQGFLSVMTQPNEETRLSLEKPEDSGDNSISIEEFHEIMRVVFKTLSSKVFATNPEFDALIQLKTRIETNTPDSLRLVDTLINIIDNESLRNLINDAGDDQEAALDKIKELLKSTNPLDLFE